MSSVKKTASTASAHSDATAVPLMQLGDSIFAESKVKRGSRRGHKRGNGLQQPRESSRLMSQ